MNGGSLDSRWREDGLVDANAGHRIGAISKSAASSRHSTNRYGTRNDKTAAAPQAALPHDWYITCSAMTGCAVRSDSGAALRRGRLLRFSCAITGAIVPRSNRIVRYAVVGLGHIAQVAVLPAFAHARRNSRLTAIVSGDRTFAPELLYFSDCILNDREPEPSGEEGLQDVRIVQALYQSARTGHPIAIRPFTKTVRPTGRQRITRPGVEKPPLVKVQSASQD
jgi:hypothetical protein